MSGATTAPAAVVLAGLRAMASEVRLFAPAGRGAADPAAVDRALAVFPEVHAACTRFEATSPLAVMNAAPDRWHDVPRVLADAVVEAQRAHTVTGGRFDPRVHDDLVRLGYDRSLPFLSGGVATDGVVTTRPTPGPWRPRVRTGRHPRVHPGGSAIDLGGIGKSLAVRWGAARLAGALDDFLLDAGGDCHCAGGGPEGDGWRVAVEDPSGGTRPVAVLALVDRGCATSSIRLRRWRAGGTEAHHLIDPATGRPGGVGLAAVTVVATDACVAEVTAKDLFLHGADGIGPAADRAGTAALWVTTDGRVAASPAMAPHVVWWGS